MNFINKRQAPSTRSRNGNDQIDEPMRSYPRRSNVPDDELESDMEMNPEASAFMSNFPNPRAVSGLGHRLSNPEDSRRFKPASIVDVPQITHEQLRFIEKIEKCYYIDNKVQLRDRHTGQIVKL